MEARLNQEFAVRFGLALGTFFGGWMGSAGLPLWQIATIAFAIFLLGCIIYVHNYMRFLRGG